MPSHAYDDTLSALLGDAGDLKKAHTKLKTGKVGRQWGLGALNRGAVVFAVSAWEGYVEAVVQEAIASATPTVGPLGVWSVAGANAAAHAKKLNTPNAANVRTLFASTIGLADITQAWHWENCDVQKAVGFLDDLLLLRHRIAHGVKPRPAVPEVDASYWAKFVSQLGKKSDEAIKVHLATSFGVTIAW